MFPHLGVLFWKVVEHFEGSSLALIAAEFCFLMGHGRESCVMVPITNGPEVLYFPSTFPGQ